MKVWRRRAKITLLAVLSTTLMIGAHLASAVESPPRTPNPGDPYFHDTWLVKSSDGLQADPAQARLVLHHASVPDVCVGPDGRSLLYYVDASHERGLPFTMSARFVDSQGAVGPALPVRIEGEEARVAVDPEAILLADGRVRLYYLAPRRGQAVKEIHSALSSDGVNFVREPGVRLSGAGVVDPAVVLLPDGTWKMYYALLDDGSGQPCVKSATSRDGLSFTADPGVRFHGAGSPGAMALADGRVRLYLDSRQGLGAWISEDGLEFRFEKAMSLGRAALDPSVVRLPGGGVLVAFKTLPYGMVTPPRPESH